MEAIGYFDGDRFFPEQQVKLPQKKRVIIRIDEKPSSDGLSADIRERKIRAWEKFAKALAECDEPPPEGMPERIHFDRELD